MIPLGTDRTLRYTPFVTWVLIALNVLIFVGMMAYGRSRGQMQEMDELTARFMLKGEGPKWFEFVTYQFLHGGVMHLVGNMLVLWVFGPNVEDRLGKIGFIAFYLGTGAIAGLVHVIFEDGAVVGASGSIAGVTGAYLVLFPRTQVKVFYFFLLIGVMWLPSWIFIVIAIAKDFIVTGTGRSGNVATIAHLGGYFSGFAVAMLLLATKILPTEGLDLFSIAKQAKRRQEFRAAAESGRRANKLPDPAGDALATARRSVSEAVAREDAAVAADAYAKLLAVAGGVNARSTLVAASQQALAMLLYTGGHRALAADAMDGFVAIHGDSREATNVRLLLAMAALNDLAQPSRAKAALDGIKVEPADAEQRDLLRSLRERVAGAGGGQA